MNSMNSINRYCGYQRKESLLKRLMNRIMYGKQKAEVIKPLHVISYRPATYPAGWKGGNV